MFSKNKIVELLNVLGVMVLTLGVASTLRAAVFDGGSFSQDKVSAHTDMGADGPEPQPSNFAFEQDRFSSAPVGKAFYVLGEDNKCYWGNFAYNKYEKALIVYFKTPLSTDRCLYQKQLDAKPSGYSVSAKMGGVCVPTLGVGDSTAASSFKLEETGNPVAFSYCVDQTVSYGDNFKGGAPQQQVAVGSSAPAPASVTASAAAPAAAPVAVGYNGGVDSIVDAPLKSGAHAEPFKMGPSVQDAVAPWKSGAVYREGFPSVTNEAREWHAPAAQPAPASINDSTPVDTSEVQSFQASNTGAATTAATTTSGSPIFTTVPVGSSAVIPNGFVTKSHEGVYTIQVSSVLTSEDAAEKLKALKAKGFNDAWVMKAEVNGTTHYRICIGHYKSGKEAKEAQPNVAVKSGVKEAFIQKVVDRAPASVGRQDD